VGCNAIFNAGRMLGFHVSPTFYGRYLFGVKLLDSWIVEEGLTLVLRGFGSCFEVGWFRIAVSDEQAYLLMDFSGF
jgi:hypothetical protein